MGEEIEVKILHISPPEIHMRLIALGATFLGDEFQINEIFGDRLEGLLVRLRTVNGITVLTTKHPIATGPYKKRHELESLIVNRGVFVEQLEMLGFPRTWYLEKRRAIYQLGDAAIAIDEYPGIPHFAEIEGVEAQIQSVVTGLGYSMAETVVLCFQQLIEQYHPGHRELRFTEQLP